MAVINLRLRAKLLSGFIIITLLGLGSSLIARFYLSEMGAAMANQYRLVTQPSLQLIKISQTFQNMGIATRDIMLSGNDADLNRAVMFMDGQKSFMEGALADYEPMVPNPDDQALLQGFKAKLAKYQEDIAKVIDLMAANDQAAISAMLKNLRTQAAGLQTTINTLLDNMETLASTQAEMGAARVQTTTFFMILLGSSTVVLSLVLGLVISRRIARSVAAMGSLSTRIATGDLTGAIAPRLLAQTDEIGELSRAIESMKADILANISGIKQAVSALGHMGEGLVESTDSARRAVRGIQTSMDTVSSKVLDQSSGVTETSATVNQILKNIEQLDRRIEEQASALTQSSASIEQMISNIQSVTRNTELMGQCFGQLKQAGDAGNQKLTVMTRLIQAVAGHSDKLLAANTSINSIAAQTNLLAMNAAIEAAHAGDSGRGFAVVADEIRKLAELAARQSQDISIDIKEIRKVITAIVGSSDETGRSFLDIMAQMQTLGQMESEIKRAMLEQGEGSHQILEAIAGINGVTADVRRGSREITEGSQAIALEMKQLTQASQDLGNLIEDIKAATLQIGTATDLVVATAADSGEAVRQLAGRVEHYTV